MIYTNDQFTGIALLFEKENGRNHSDFENKWVTEICKELKTDNTLELETNIIRMINSSLLIKENQRIRAYWALGKRFNLKLIPFFQKCLKKELVNHKLGACFEIMISLSNMGEEVFSKNSRS